MARARELKRLTTSSSAPLGSQVLAAMVPKARGMDGLRVQPGDRDRAGNGWRER